MLKATLTRLEQIHQIDEILLLLLKLLILTLDLRDFTCVSFRGVQAWSTVSKTSSTRRFLGITL